MVNPADDATEHTIAVDKELGQSDHESSATKDEEHLSDKNHLLLLDNSTTDREESIHPQACDDEAEQADQEHNANSNNSGYCFGNEFYFQIKLMKILHNTNTPKYLYQEIIKWAQEAQEANLSFFNVLKSRKGLIHQAENWMPYLKQNARHSTNYFGDTWKPTSGGCHHL